MKGKKEEIMEYNDYIVNNINRVAIALSATRRVPPLLRLKLRDVGLWDDILQAAVTAAYDPKIPNSPRAVYNAAQREIYAELRGLGFFRPSPKERRSIDNGFVMREKYCSPAELEIIEEEAIFKILNIKRKEEK